MDNQPSSASEGQTLRSWRKLAATFQGIPPAGYLRAGLFLAAVAGVCWVLWQTRAALLPFLVGGALAYILLPVVNALDRLMPRMLAVAIALVLLLGFLGFIFYLLIPPLVAQAPNFIRLIPDRAGIQALVDRLRQAIQTLPPSTQESVIKLLQTVSLSLREYLDQNLNGLAGVVALFLITIFNSIGFVLGFLVVPAWLLTVLKDQRRGVRTLNRVLPAAVQKDFWAVAQIIDRPLRTYVSGQFLLAIVTGIAVYFSFVVLEKLGWQTIQYKVPLALWAAVFELIPDIGPYLGAVPAVLGGFYRSPQIGLMVIGLYIVLHYLINRFVGSRVENRMLQVHPAILLIVIVAMSQLGFIWVLLAAPVIAILIDLFRYGYGRLSDPPLPAGVLPGQPVPQAATSQEPPVYRVPLAYRRSRAARRPSERI
jgi:predicted PurR-regulated permease PerM